MIMAALGWSGVLGAVASPSAKGVSYLIEARAGAGYGGGFAEGGWGLGGGLSLGIGGTFEDQPIALFGTLHFGLQSFDGEIRNALHHSDISRTIISWTVGLKCATWVSPEFSIVIEAGFGGLTLESASSLNGGMESLRSSDGSFLADVGGGIDYHVGSGMRLGLRFNASFPLGLETFDFLAEASGGASDEAGVANIAMMGVVGFEL